MYNLLKRILITLIFCVLSVGGVLFVLSNQSEMFNGYTDIIYVDKATLDFKEQLQQIAQETNSVFAKRIVVSQSNETGQLVNTYVPIGASTLPKKMPLQTNQEIIGKSNDNELYIVIKSDVSIQELVMKLQMKNNLVRIGHINYQLVLLKLFFSSPHSFMIVFVFLTAFSTLILAEYISKIKKIGIQRISGESKYSISLKQIYKDSLFLVGISLLNLVGVVVSLSIFDVFSIAALWIILTPIVIAFSMFISINFILSHIFYYILQKQPIILSVKGKAPMKTIFFIVILTQLLTLLSVMYSMYGVQNVTNDMVVLESGQKEWKKYVDYYQITPLAGENITDEAYNQFYQSLENITDIISVHTTLNNESVIDKSLKNSYFPTADDVSNVIFVNSTFIVKNDIKLSNDLLEKINKLNVGDAVVLVPKTQEHQYQLLAKTWIKFLTRGLAPDDVTVSEMYPNAQRYSGIYENKSPNGVFIFPVFSAVGQLFSDESFVNDPIIIVEKNERYNPADIRVSHPEQVIELIKSQNMTGAFGSLVNGLYSINNRVQNKQKDQITIMLSTMISILSAILLFSLLNIIYFYQNRKKHFIQKLAGLSTLFIHKVYIMTTILSCLTIALVSALLQLPLIVSLTPLGYMIGIFIIFFIQLYREKNVNVLYLKGE